MASILVFVATVCRWAGGVELPGACLTQIIWGPGPKRDLTSAIATADVHEVALKKALKTAAAPQKTVLFTIFDGNMVWSSPCWL